ncbi:MAG TPA: hypothetical protein VMQ63_02520, partial [Stellaceae bacterium]|nr:hypothetical protein [Stellaceae bacterium]
CTMEDLEKAVARANRGKKAVVRPPTAEDIAAATEPEVAETVAEAPAAEEPEAEQPIAAPSDQPA